MIERSFIVSKHYYKVDKMKYRFIYDDLDTMRVINQSNVTQFVYPSPNKYNAIWDSILHPNGKIYFALCTELTTSAYTKLVEYDVKNNTVRDIFDAENMILPNERFIRDSKLHTSLSVMEDGVLIMATHTTDKAPEHPAWMPYSNYSNPWEGFAGSSILTYDPNTDKTENHGILVPRETLYGGLYDPKNRVYYTLGFMKGHLYQYHLDTRKVVDLGKQVEKASYRLLMGPDDNIYFSTRNGHLKRINTTTQKVETLPYVLPNASHKGYNHAYLTTGASQDDNLFMAGMHHDEISVYNTTSNNLETVGRYVDFDLMIKEYETTKYIGAMTFDDEKNLWYVVCGARLDNNEDFITASILMKWDLVNPPIDMGIVGTETRASVRTCGIHYNEGILTIVGTNHANDGVEITNVNTRNLTPNKGPICTDPLIYPNNGNYTTYGQSIVDHWSIVDDNHFYNKHLFNPIPLWKQLKSDEKITSIFYDTDLMINTNYTNYVLRNGELVPSNISIDEKPTKDFSHIKNLPFYNGRQYRAIVDKYIQFDDGSYLVSTLDGMFALINDNSVFSLGALGVFSPIKDMIKIDDQTVIGILGDRDDINQLFRFNREQGLKVLGMAAYEDSKLGAHHSASLGSLAYDKENETIAIASDDEMATIYFIRKGDIT